MTLHFRECDPAFLQVRSSSIFWGMCTSGPDDNFLLWIMVTHTFSIYCLIILIFGSEAYETTRSVCKNYYILTLKTPLYENRTDTEPTCGDVCYTLFEYVTCRNQIAVYLPQIQARPCKSLIPNLHAFCVCITHDHAITHARMHVNNKTAGHRTPKKMCYVCLYLL